MSNNTLQTQGLGNAELETMKRLNKIKAAVFNRLPKHKDVNFDNVIVLRRGKSYTYYITEDTKELYRARTKFMDKDYYNHEELVNFKVRSYWEMTAKKLDGFCACLTYLNDTTRSEELLETLKGVFNVGLC
jgi:hypothetical protein